MTSISHSFNEVQTIMAAKSLILFALLSATVLQGAVIKPQDGEQHRRVARSPCNDGSCRGPPGPPPPPPPCDPPGPPGPPPPPPPHRHFRGGFQDGYQQQRNTQSYSGAGVQVGRSSEAVSLASSSSSAYRGQGQQERHQVEQVGQQGQKYQESRGSEQSSDGQDGSNGNFEGNGQSGHAEVDQSQQSGQNNVGGAAPALQGPAGCSTCTGAGNNRGNSATSNAQSYNGKAVAISVSGK